MFDSPKRIRSRQTPPPGRAGSGFPWILVGIVLVAAGFWWMGTKPEQQRDEVPVVLKAPRADTAPRLHELQELGEFPLIKQPQASGDFAHLAAQLLDPSAALKGRRGAAWALARLGTDDAIQALSVALTKAPPYLQAAIAEGLGESTNRAAPALLASLLGSADEIVARGAIRGIAVVGGPESVEVLGRILNDADRPVSLRTEAALALGDIDLAGASELLKGSASGSQDEIVLESILSGLGKRPFSETAGFFTDFLASADASVSSKAAAVEALSDGGAEASLFLLQCLEDSSAEIRAAAAWALSSGEQGNLGAQLAALLASENNPTVRTRLYQALENQSGADPLSVLPGIQTETDTLVRLAALDFLAGQIRRSATPEIIDYFEGTALRELWSQALTSKNLQVQLGSVIALGRAGTLTASGALQDVVQKSGEPKVVQAAQAALVSTYRK
jgi:HEAT repeat protein